MSYDPLDDFVISPFTYEGVTHDVYRKGSGPAVIVMHEIPGITPKVARFTRSVVDAGFTVFMPNMFGTPGKPPTLAYAVSQIARACVSREFAVLRRHGSSPITVWLRALARHAHEEIGGRGVGAIGMCLTGNFALALTLEPCMMAPVLSQPSLPFPVSPIHSRAVHLSEEGMRNLKRRCAEEGLCVLGLRFADDMSSPPARFETLRQELGDGFEGVEIPNATVAPKYRPSMAHSVVTEHLIDADGHPTQAARDRVLSFFEERLR